MRKVFYLFLGIIICSQIASCAPQAMGDNASPAISRQSVIKVDSDKPREIENAETVLPVDISERLTGFMLDSMPKNGNVNICYSPLSLYFATALIAEGANGETKEGLIKAISSEDLDADELGRICKSLYYTLNAQKGGSDFRIANSVWMDKDITFTQKFVDKASASYSAEMFGADFSSEETERIIGSWVAQNTNNSMSRRVTIDAETVLLVMNTVYFKGEWKELFDPAQTKTGKFKTTDGKNIECSFMHSTALEGTYIKDKEFTMACIPMSSGEKMAFILPAKNKSISGLLEDKTALKKAFYTENADNGLITWSVPKFEFDAENDVKNMLYDMGAKKAFTAGEADFSGIAETGLFISEAKQMLHIAINENGVEASSFTQYEAAAADPGELKKVKMVLDRPFVFVIFNKENMPLFTGVLNDPTLN